MKNRFIIIGLKIIAVIGYILFLGFPCFFGKYLNLESNLILYDFFILIFSLVVFIVIVRLVFRKMNDI